MEMLNLRSEAVSRQLATCAEVLRNELGLPPDAKVTAETVLQGGGGDSALRRKQALEELSMAQTEVV